MTTPRFAALAAIAVALSLSGCSNRNSYSADDGKTGATPFDRLSSEITGTFSNVEQAAQRSADGKPIWMNVELHIVEIYVPQHMYRAGAGVLPSRWFYVEQAEVGLLDKPYRQHITEVIQSGDNELATRTYTFTGDAHRFAGWWKHPESFGGHFGPADIEERLGCEGVFHSKGDGVFSGGTVGTGCPNDSKGASYATSEVTVTPTELRAWDRGFDASGRQVWGSTTGPYIFKKK